MREIKIEVRRFDNKKLIGYERINSDGYLEVSYNGLEWRKGAFIDEQLYFKLIRRMSTGLTDKNGVEIFENDVMQDRFGAICQIVYVDGFGRFMQKSKMGHTPLNQASVISDNDKVIGNSFDNPELLD